MNSGTEIQETHIEKTNNSENGHGENSETDCDEIPGEVESEFNQTEDHVNNKDGKGNLHPDQLEDLKESFHILDQVDDGDITPAKLYRAANSLLRDNLTESEVQDLINHGDTNGDGKIQFDEYLEIMKPQINTEPSGDDIMRAFRAFDRDDSGAIDIDDLTTMLKLMDFPCNTTDLQNMIKSANGGTEDQVNFQDFKRLLEDGPHDEYLEDQT